MAAVTKSVSATQDAYIAVAEGQEKVRLQVKSGADVRVVIAAALPDADEADYFDLKGGDALPLDGLSSGDNVYVRGEFSTASVNALSWSAQEFGAVTLRPSAGDTIASDGSDYADEGSYQLVGPDLNLDADAGRNVADGTSFLAPIMGNVIGDALTKTGNYLAGLIGMFSLTGTKATHYPAGAVLAGIADGVTQADGAVVAFIDGDSAQTNAGAAFKVRNNNSTAASGFDYGLDLQDAAHDGFQPVDAAFYKKGLVRLVSDVIVLVGSGVPVDYTDGDPAATGAGYAGPGSIYVRTATGKLYLNGGTKAQPLWKLVTSA